MFHCRLIRQVGGWRDALTTENFTLINIIHDSSCCLARNRQVEHQNIFARQHGGIAVTDYGFYVTALVEWVWVDQNYGVTQITNFQHNCIKIFVGCFQKRFLNVIFQ